MAFLCGIHMIPLLTVFSFDLSTKCLFSWTDFIHNKATHRSTHFCEVCGAMFGIRLWVKFDFIPCLSALGLTPVQGNSLPIHWYCFSVGRYYMYLHLLLLYQHINWANEVFHSWRRWVHEMCVSDCERKS